MRLGYRCRMRRGSVTLLVMVCLLIVMTMAAQMLRQAMIERRQTQLDRQMRQTHLLLQAGINRALNRLEIDAQYQGETWRLPPDVLGWSGGEVVIAVQAESESDRQVATIRVVARITPENQTSRRTQRSREFSYRYQRN